MRPGAVIEWVRRLPPTVADGLLAALVTVVALPQLLFGSPVFGELGIQFRPTNVLAVLLVLAETVPLTWRRRAPVTVLAVGCCASMATLLAGFRLTSADLALIVGLYTVAAHSPRPKAWIAGLGVAALAIAQEAIVQAKYGHTTWQDYLLLVVEVGMTWFFGELQRRRRDYTGKLEQLNRLLEARQSVARELIKRRTRQALAEERGRIARELHDVIAHSVSVMVVQAGAARRIAQTDPEQARGAMASIEENGRQALTEMRRLVGMLRKGEAAGGTGPETADLAPQPSLLEVETLVEQAREAGLRVDLEIEGEPRPLPAAVDLSAYRIVQEALTNVRKHAGRATARVRLRYGDDDLEVRVDDDGRGQAAPSRQPQPQNDADRDADGERDARHGLIGMRERVALFGGDLRVGPRPGGGFRVAARLPLLEAATRERERGRAAQWSES